jgi:hypothetical protein
VGWNWENTATRRSGPPPKTKTSKLVAHTSARLLTYDTDADAEPRSCASCDITEFATQASATKSGRCCVSCKLPLFANSVQAAGHKTKNKKFGDAAEWGGFCPITGNWTKTKLKAMEASKSDIFKASVAAMRALKDTRLNPGFATWVTALDLKSHAQHTAVLTFLNLA